MKKKSSQPKPPSFNKLTIILVVAITIGIAAGYFLRTSGTGYKLATPQEIEAAKNMASLIISESRYVASCSDVQGDQEARMGKVAVDYRNVRVNRFANRVIVTDCAEKDELLVKTKLGSWDYTNVRLELSQRANPIWQKECLIDDITVPDEIVRAENTEIDKHNLEECIRIKNL